MSFGAKKDTEASAYQQLEKAHRDLRAFRDLHKRVFDKEADLKEKVEIVENALKLALRSKYAGQPSGEYTAFTGDFISVTVQSKYNRVVDPQGLIELVPDAYEMGLIEHTVDLKMLDKMIEGGTLTAEQIEPLITRTAGTPAVAYKLVKVAKEGE